MSSPGDSPAALDHNLPWLATLVIVALMTWYALLTLGYV
jgi:hypothetical protein